MTHNHPARRTLLIASLVLAGQAAAVRGQDLYKSRAEMLQAEAATKEANAAVIGAIANYDKAQAEVAKMGQEVRGMQTQNNLLETEVYYKRRAQYHEYQAAHRPKPRTREEYTTRAQRAAPDRLASYHFGTSSGDIRWPTLLNAPPYETLRHEIDELLKSRTPDDSGAGSQNSVDIAALIERLKAVLRSNIRRYASNDYLAARKFLDAVALEAQEPLFSIRQTQDKVAGR